MSSYAFHPEALNDLDQIWDYIAEHDPFAADQIIDAVLDKLGLLAETPYIGHHRPDLTSRPLRFAVVRTTSSPIRLTHGLFMSFQSFMADATRALSRRC